jgi:DDE family transposase
MRENLGLTLDDAAGILFWSALEELDVPLYLHPWPSVPDPRSRLGRWHPLEFVLALAVCAYTAAGHDCAEAIAEWAAGCSQETMAVLGGRHDPQSMRIRPPSARTFGRILEKIDAEAFNAAL